MRTGSTPRHRGSSPARTRFPIALLLPQNEQHLETAAILAPRLAARGLSPEVLLMDGLFHQRLDARALPPVAAVRHLALRLPAPFYRLDPVRQVLAVARAARPVARAVGHPDAVIAFNDGAIQRLAFRAASDAPVAIVIDGMISDYAEPAGRLPGVRALLKRAGTTLRSTPLGVVLPSDVGLSPVDRVFVVGEHSAGVLRKMGSRADKIIATGLPRWPAADPRETRPARLRRIVYLSGAFAWHARAASAAAQIEDAATLASVCGNLGIELAIRVHPRDDADRWRVRGLPLIDARSESMHDSIRHADLVVSMISTGLLEAISLGRIARSVIIADDVATFGRSFAADPFLGLIRSRRELERALQGYLIGGFTAADYDLQNAGLVRYVAASGDAAADRIADDMTALLAPRLLAA